MYQKYKNVETVKPGGLELKDKLVGVQRVTKVTKGGRAFGFSAIVVVGDEHGVVGHGLGKSKEVATAIAKAIEDAKKNLIRIPLNGHTLPHEQKGKFGRRASDLFCGYIACNETFISFLVSNLSGATC